MIIRISILLLSLAGALACAGGGSARPTSVAPEPDTTWFLVRDQQGELVEHARIFLVTSNGTTVLADRTENGLLVGTLPDLPTNPEGALLACAEGYYCAGWLLDDPFLEADLKAEGGMISITLTPLVLH